MNKLKQKLQKIEEEGKVYRDNIRTHFTDLLRDISHIGDSVHHQELAGNQTGMATGESRSASRNGAEGRGKEKGKTTD